MDDQRPLPWIAVIATGAVLFLMVVATPPLAAKLAQHGWNGAIAMAAVFGAGGLLVAAVMMAVLVRTGRTHLSPRLVEGLAFSIVTLTLIFLVQIWLADAFDGFGWPDEITHYASWLTAIVIVGYPADLVRRRLGIEFPARVGSRRPEA